MQTAKVFKSGNSQAIRLSKDFQFRGSEGYIEKMGNYVVIIPKEDPWKIVEESVGKFTSDIFEGGREQMPPKSERAWMIYMLDTNICIYTMKKNPPGVFDHLRKLAPDSVGISAINEAELRFGMSNSSKPEHNHRILDEFLGPFHYVSAKATSTTPLLYQASRFLLTEI